MKIPQKVLVFLRDVDGFLHFDWRLEYIYCMLF